MNCTQSTITLIEALNQALTYVGAAPVVTTTDNHESRIMLNLFKQAVQQVQNSYDWAELIADAYLYEFAAHKDPVVYGNHIGWCMPSPPNVLAVRAAADNAPLCLEAPNTFYSALEDDVEFGMDSTTVTMDSTEITMDADDINEYATHYTVARNRVFIRPAVRNASDYLVTYIQPLSVPTKDSNVFNCTDSLVNIIILCAAFNYAATYMPARKGTATPAAGLAQHYNNQLRLYRTRQGSKTQGSTVL